MRICAFVVSFLLIAAVSFAADIDGTYSGEVETRMGGFGGMGGRMGGGMGGGMGNSGPMIFTFNLKKGEGTELTGTFQGQYGQPVEIRDGIIKGKKVWFLVDRDMNQQKTVYSFKGKLSGNKLKLEFKTVTENSQFSSPASKINAERVN